MDNVRFPRPAPDRRVEIPARRLPPRGAERGITWRHGYEVLEGLSLFAGLAAAALGMADGIAPVASAISGFATACITDLFATALMGIVLPGAIHHPETEEPLS